MKTYNDIYLDVRKRLKAAGIEAFNIEARLIVASAANKKREAFLSDLNLYVNEGYTEKVESMLKRRLEGEPVAYITGEWEFYGLPLDITPDVLIPRVDTEVLAENAIHLLRGNGDGIRVLDLCCGSGCIGLAIAEHVPDCRVVLADNSPAALDLSRENVQKNNLSRNVTCMRTDALDIPPMLLGKFDMLVCNPPYIPTADIIKLDHSVRDYEPIHALDGGPDGLDYYRAIIPKWEPVMRDLSFMLFECGEGQAVEVCRILEANGMRTTVFKDTNGVERVVSGLMARNGIPEA